MNNKKARMLRKQAGGNTAEFLPENIRNPTRNLTHRCTRKKYKDLKYLYRLIGI